MLHSYFLYQAGQSPRQLGLAHVYSKLGGGDSRETLSTQPSQHSQDTILQWSTAHMQLRFGKMTHGSWHGPTEQAVYPSDIRVGTEHLRQKQTTAESYESEPTVKPESQRQLPTSNFAAC